MRPSCCVAILAPLTYSVIMVDENCRFGLDVGFWLAVNIFPSCSETISTWQSPVLKHLASVKAPFALCCTCTAAYVLPPTLCIIRCAIICRVASSSWSNGRARKEGNTLHEWPSFLFGHNGALSAPSADARSCLHCHRSAWLAGHADIYCVESLPVWNLSPGPAAGHPSRLSNAFLFFVVIVLAVSVQDVPCTNTVYISFYCIGCL
jgi:hypothetical protein